MLIILSLLSFHFFYVTVNTASFVEIYPSMPSFDALPPGSTVVAQKFFGMGGAHFASLWIVMNYKFLKIP